MTEAEWLTADDPRPMFKALDPTMSLRKLRLFGCGACRRLWWLTDSCSRAAVEASERYADGLYSESEIELRSAVVRDELEDVVTEPSADEGSSTLLARAAFCISSISLHKDLVWEAIFLVAEANWPNPNDESAPQADLLRDVFGNPSQPVAFSPEWRTYTVVALAAQVYESRDFSAMPILADALQDAGCDSADVLDHCRGPGPHVRGCWVVDLVLGKE